SGSRAAKTKTQQPAAAASERPAPIHSGDMPRSRTSLSRNTEPQRIPSSSTSSPSRSDKSISRTSAQSRGGLSIGTRRQRVVGVEDRTIDEPLPSPQAPFPAIGHRSCLAPLPARLPQCEKGGFRRETKTF